MPFTLPPLPFPKDSLEPHISAETIEYHYGKHHAGYINKLNSLIAGKPEESMTLEEIILNSKDKSILNNACQAYNHEFYFNGLINNSKGVPIGEIEEEIKKKYKSFSLFKEEFTSIAIKHFASGWIWLCYSLINKELFIIDTHDAALPYNNSNYKHIIPILNLDVWEHAYYIDKRNDRQAYVNAWWSVVNWDFANKNLAKAKKLEAEKEAK